MLHCNTVGCLRGKENFGVMFYYVEIVLCYMFNNVVEGPGSKRHHRQRSDFPITAQATENPRLTQPLWYDNVLMY